jgi:hypothetical protein
LKYFPLPSSVEPYIAIEKLVYELCNLITGCVSIEAKYVCPLISFILATWIGDLLPMASGRDWTLLIQKK